MKIYPSLIVSCLFAMGIIIAEIVGRPLGQTYYFVLIIFLVSFLIFIKSIPYVYKFFIILLLTISTGFFVHSANNLNHLKTFAPDIYLDEVSISGKVEKVDLLGSRYLRFQIISDSVLFRGKTIKVNYLFQVSLNKEDTISVDSVYAQILPGRKISVIGNMYNKSKVRVPGEFNYSEYLRGKGICGSINLKDPKNISVDKHGENYFASRLLWIRQGIADIFSEYTTVQSAGLLKSLLLGDRNDISAETRSEFVKAGVIHILAISGLHVGFIAVLFSFLFGRFCIITRSTLTILGLFLFLFISGMSVSVLRAVIMGTVFFIAKIFDKETSIFNSLGIAALIILIFSPNSLFDISFQLSFAAVFSIAYIYPKLEKIIINLKIKPEALKSIFKLFSVTLAAQIGTIPLVLLYFGKLSIISLITNILVIPIAGIIVGMGILLIAVSFLVSFLPVITGEAINGVIILLFNIIARSSSYSFSYINVAGYNMISLLIYYGSLALLFFLLKKFSSALAKVVLIIFTSISISVFSGIVQTEFFEKGKLNILFVDVGQGDATLIRFPNGKSAIVDAGDIKFRDSGVKTIAPLLAYLGIDIIDYGFITHYDLDHFGGMLNLIYHNKIKNLIIPPIDTCIEVEKKLTQFINRHSVKFSEFKKTIINVGESKMFLLNSPPKSGISANMRSGVILIQHGKTKVLLTGDIEYPGELELIHNYAEQLDSDVLKVAHHGSKTSTSDEFISKVTPKISIISAGVNNRFGHPHINTLYTLKKFKSDVYRTDKEGSILLVSDGVQFKKFEWQ